MEAPKSHARAPAALAQEVSGIRLLAVIKELIRLKGIGRWTVQMFTIFALFRPDVLSVDDFGFRTTPQRQYVLPGPGQ